MSPQRSSYSADEDGITHSWLRTGCCQLSSSADLQLWG